MRFTSVSKLVLVHNLPNGNKFFLHVNCLAINPFLHERLCTRTRFETEVKSNSEMASCLKLEDKRLTCRQSFLTKKDYEDAGMMGRRRRRNRDDV